MFFALLVFFAAFLIEGIGTYVSVVGLSSLFAANPVIITLAVALDIGKVVSVSFLYKYWSKVNLLMKSYMTVAALVLMLITSAGAFGFLSGEFQKAIANTNTQSVLLTSLTEEQGRLQKRKEDIDKQIASIPEKYTATQRIRTIAQFKDEQKQVTARLQEIDKQLPELKVDAIKKNVEVGPIIYVAEAFHTTPEQAVKWVILIIIFVFDPLAISLLLAGNYLVELRAQEKKEKELQDSLKTFEPEKHGGEFPAEPINEPLPEIVEAVPETITPVAVVKDEFAPVYEPNVLPIEEVKDETPTEASVTQEPVPATETTTDPVESVGDVELVPEPVIAEPLPAPEPEVVIEEPVAEETPAPEPEVVEEDTSAREVVTMEQITSPPTRHMRSSLEDISTGGDVETTLPGGLRDTRPAHQVQLAYDNSEAVTVGGPSGRTH